MVRRVRPGFDRTRISSTAMVPAVALLPLRVFFGITFVYAGLDKLLSPGFFDPDNAASIQAQFTIFERVSPLAPLVHLVEPLAVVLGVLIALGELAVGLGALTGLAFRLAALGGAFFSLLFFLTASWTTHPYYFGPDLPYALGWLTLALAGPGGLFVLRLARTPKRAPSETPLKQEQPILAQLINRRLVLQVSSLAALTLGVGSLAGVARLFQPPLVPIDDGGGTPSPGSPAPSGPPPSGAPSDGPSPAPGIAITTVADVTRTGSRRFTVPIAAPAPLPAGDPGVVIQLDDGSFVAYDALCTHEACRVGWDPRSAVLFCPCHGAEFDAADHGAVLAGPTTIPLTELPLVINEQDGTIALRLT